jgi:hypothetical protein
MSDPNRLLQEGASGFERQLLSAALTDHPTRETRTRLLVSLGVAGATTTAATSAGGASATGALSTATKAWALKSLCAVALTATAGAVTIRVVGSSAVHDPTSAVSAVRAASTVRAAPAPLAVEAVAIPAVQSAPLPVASSLVRPSPAPEKPAGRRQALVSAPRVVAAPPASPPAEAPPKVDAFPRASSSSLTEETSSLDAARTALRAGRVTETLALLDESARRFPSGLLQPEASAVRVEALLAAGDRLGAETVARALVATAPRTFAAHRVKAMLNW